MKSIFLVFTLFSVSILANDIQIPLIERLGSPSVAGHRGGFFDESNNTIEQFQRAINQGVDILEMDLRASKDGVVFVFHDEEMRNHSNCRGYIHRLESSYIKNCKYKTTQHLIPTLEDVLKFVDGRVIVNAEFKDLEAIKPSLALVKEYNARNWVYFQANSDRQKYFEARKIDPTIAMLLKAENDKDLKFIADLQDPNLIIVHFNKEDATPQRLAFVKSLGKLTSVNSWKYDLLEERFSSSCLKVFNLGFDIAVTNNNKACVKAKQEFISNP